jgi:hypothetical protein
VDEAGTRALRARSDIEPRDPPAAARDTGNGPQLDLTPG